ncbi:MAG: hypothetical protein AAF682_11935 [Planctomycetota bacterium]
MIHYFLGMAVLATPALLATAGTGIFHDGTNLHLSLGLFGAILTVATHTLLILFMIVTGKVMKEASASRQLPASFLEELNEFFARKRAYPISGLAAVTIVAVAVLGYGQHAFGLPAEVHMLLGILAVLFNLWAIQVEYQALRENQGLLDRTAAALDAIDRERAERGEPLEAEEDEEPGNPFRAWVIVAFSAWLPYLYWGFVEWGGDFARVGSTFTVLTAAVSAGSLVAAWMTRSSGDGAALS